MPMNPKATRHMMVWLVALVIGVSTCVPPAPAKQPPAYTVAKVKVNTEASDAVAAKEKAIALGGQRALRILMSRLVAFKAHNRLPELGTSTVDGLLDGFVVRDERFSSTRYVAILDFTFDAAKIRDLINRFGLPHTDQQSQAMTLLPVAYDGIAIQDWRAAWSELDLKHGLTPLVMTPAQAAARLPTDMELTKEAVIALKDRLGASRLVLAAASVDGAGERLRVAMIGKDSIGQFSFSQSFRIHDDDVGAAASHGAQVARLALEARWRETALRTQGALDGPAPLETFTLTAAFDSLRAWQEMRRTIESISGAQDIEIKSLFAGGADVVLSFPGGPDRFAKAAGAKGLSMRESRGEWILRRQ